MADELLKEVEKGIADLFKDGTDDPNARNEKFNANPYINVEKSSVLIATRDFHDASTVRNDPRRIITTITQLLYLQNSRRNPSRRSTAKDNSYKVKNSNNNTNGVSTLTHTEATDVFFGVTKLFVSTNHRLLRRMVYVVLKDLVHLCHPSDIIIITSCLTKDMTSNDAIYRANALRVLVRIIDSSLLSAIERYVKQAILDSSSKSSLSSSSISAASAMSNFSSPFQSPISTAGGAGAGAGTSTGTTTNSAVIQTSVSSPPSSPRSPSNSRTSFRFNSHGVVSSSALVSTLYLISKSPEDAAICKKWSVEVYEALRNSCNTNFNASASTNSGSSASTTNNCTMVQFHALVLYYQMKKSDRLAISKFVQQFCSSTMASGALESGLNISPTAVGRSFHFKNKRGGGRGGNSGGNSRNNVPSLQSPLAITCLIRYTLKLLLEEVMEGRISSFTNVDDNASSSSSYQLCKIGYKFLKSCLRHESEMVAFEAASSMCSLCTATPLYTNTNNINKINNVNNDGSNGSNSNDLEIKNAEKLQDIQPALSVLQILLSSHKPAARLGTIKILYKLSTSYPQFVSGGFNDSLEALIGDSNRLIGTLSIMTLMKTLGRSSTGSGEKVAIDRLLKHISSFVSHIADEYKIMVIKSLEQLCISYPNKFSLIISFLSKFLREDGGFHFKRTIVLSVESLMIQIPETRDLALLYLCEFIEDCEYITLSSQILTILGNLGPTTLSPARYVRFIYNRCILENAKIRAASVSALGKFGAGCPSLRFSILRLLRSCLMDESDETRDRAVLAISILEDADEKCPYVASSSFDHGDYRDDNGEQGRGTNHDEKEEEDPAVFLLMDKLPCTFDNLERRLKSYRDTPGAMESDDALTFDDLPVVEDSKVEDGVVSSNDQPSLFESVIGQSPSLKGDISAVTPDLINNIPEFAAFGRVFQSSKSVPLTETEAEYVVHCVKHIFDQHIVFQYFIQNTIEDQRLENVSVCVESDTDSFDVTGEIPAQNISYGTSASCFTVLERNSDTELSSCIFGCELKFTVIQVDPASGEEEGDPYDEEYPVENVEIFVSDFIIQTRVPDFRKCWESIGNAHEVLQKFSLQEQDVASAVKAVIDCMGMQTCDGTQTVKPSARQHMLHLSGTFIGGVTVVARSQISLGPSGVIILKIAIRSGSAEVSKLVSGCLG